MLSFSLFNFAIKNDKVFKFKTIKIYDLAGIKDLKLIHQLDSTFDPAMCFKLDESIKFTRKLIMPIFQKLKEN